MGINQLLAWTLEQRGRKIILTCWNTNTELQQWFVYHVLVEWWS